MYNSKLLLPAHIPCKLLTGKILTTKVYALLDKDNSIRYIGITINTLSYRLSGHLYKAKNIKHKTYRDYWIRSCLANGYTPRIMLIGEIDGDGSKEEIA